MTPGTIVDYAVAIGISIAIIIDLVGLAVGLAVKSIRRITKEKP